MSHLQMEQKCQGLVPLSKRAKDSPTLVKLLHMWSYLGEGIVVMWNFIAQYFQESDFEFLIVIGLLFAVCEGTFYAINHHANGWNKISPTLIVDPLNFVTGLSQRS